jgi:hypothetical protein
VAEWSNAAVLKTCKRVFRRSHTFLSKSSKALLSKGYNPIATFAPIGKEWHDKAVTLPISANWNPLEKPLRDDLSDDARVSSLIVPLAAYCEAMRGCVAAPVILPRVAGVGSNAQAVGGSLVCGRLKRDALDPVFAR